MPNLRQHHNNAEFLSSQPQKIATCLAVGLGIFRERGVNDLRQIETGTTIRNHHTTLFHIKDLADLQYVQALPAHEHLRGLVCVKCLIFS